MSKLLPAKELVLGYTIKSVQLQCRVQWGEVERERRITFLVTMAKYLSKTFKGRQIYIILRLQG